MEPVPRSVSQSAQQTAAHAGSAAGLRRLRAAVVGCQIGARHAEAYHALADRYELVAVCDTNRDRAAALAGRCGGVEAVTDFAQLLGRGDLDVVSLCTPPHLHVAQIRAALAAGIHVVCEKPVAGTLHDIDELAAAARAAGRTIVPIFQSRFGHGVQKLFKLVRSGVSGRCYLSTIETAWQRGQDYYSVPWRRTWQGSLGGCVIGHAIHALDILGYVVGPVRRVSAFTRTLVNPVETEDCASASLEMADGSLATVAVTLGSAREISRLRFCFEKLVAESNAHPYHYACDPWTFTGISPAVDREIEAVLKEFPMGPEGYEAQFVRMHAALAGAGDSPVSLADARATLELVSAIYASAETGAIVGLPLPPDHPFVRSCEPARADALT